jgi:hypothetical protein
MKRTMALFAIILLAVSAVAQGAEAIKNWPAPSTWTPPAAQATSGRSALGGGGGGYPPLPFIPIAPCRVADTRGNGFTGSYGPPSMAGGASRNFTITAQCGIPDSAVAVSFNFTVWNTSSYGDFNIYPTGGTRPVVSTLNWGPGVLALANAAVVPLGTSGQITVVNESGSTVDVFFDVNGYYASTQPIATTFTILTPAVYGIYAQSSATGGYGVLGFAGASGTGVYGSGGAYGVYGYSSGGQGVYGVSSTNAGVYGNSTSSVGVVGISNGGGLAGVLGQNGAAIDGSQGVGGLANGAAKVFGVQGQISTNATAGSAGVHGLGAATSGTSYGVLGETSTSASASAGVEGVNTGSGTNSAGVLGVNGSPVSSTWISAGVRGEAGYSFGVLGVSNYKAVVGAYHNGTSGANEAKGLLGYKAGSTGYAVYGEVGDFGGTGAKYFVEPHGLDAAKVIRYVALEGPESGTYFRGKARTQGGIAVIEVPDHFKMVSDEEGMTVHVTPIGQFAQTWIESADLSSVVIRSSRDVDFNYIVHGVRRAFRNFNPVDVSPEFRPENAQSRLADALPAEIKSRLVRVGIYNPDGTVNMSTAERLGWAQQWRDDEAKAKAAQETAVARAR